MSFSLPLVKKEIQDILNEELPYIDFNVTFDLDQYDYMSEVSIVILNIPYEISNFPDYTSLEATSKIKPKNNIEKDIHDGLSLICKILKSALFVEYDIHTFTVRLGWYHKVTDECKERYIMHKLSKNLMLDK